MLWVMMHVKYAVREIEYCWQLMISLETGIGNIARLLLMKKMWMSEVGLIYNDALLVVRVSVTKEPGAAFCNQNIVLAFKGTHMRTVEIRQFPLTRVGYELASISEQLISDQKMIELGDILNSHFGNDVTVSAHRRVPTNDGTIVFYKTDLLDKEYRVAENSNGV